MGRGYLLNCVTINAGAVCGLGLVRLVVGNAENVGDQIPADVVANAMLVTY